MRPGACRISRPMAAPSAPRAAWCAAARGSWPVKCHLSSGACSGCWECSPLGTYPTPPPAPPPACSKKKCRAPDLLWAIKCQQPECYACDACRKTSPPPPPPAETAHQAIPHQRHRSILPSRRRSSCECSDLSQPMTRRQRTPYRRGSGRHTVQGEVQGGQGQSSGKGRRFTLRGTLSLI